MTRASLILSLVLPASLSAQSVAEAMVGEIRVLRASLRSEHRQRIHQLARAAGDHVGCDDQHEFPAVLARRLL
jgi:hypothetical protein